MLRVNNAYIASLDYLLFTAVRLEKKRQDAKVRSEGSVELGLISLPFLVPQSSSSGAIAGAGAGASASGGGGGC